MARPFKYPPEVMAQAAILYRRGATWDEISQALGVPRFTLEAWQRRYNWAASGLPGDTVEAVIARRICLLLDLPEKSDAQRAELFGLIERFGEYGLKAAKARALDRIPAEDAAAAHQAEDHANRADVARKGWEGRRKRRPPKNDISGVEPERLARVRDLLMRGVAPADINRLLILGQEPAQPIEGRETWGYLATWHRNKHQRNRFILKSRQIGATYYFAWEALEDAILTGDNQIFLSASRDQAEVFRAYIVMFASLCLGIELSGNPIILTNGAELRFLSTNSRTAQSYHGHLYLDEVFWVPRFREMWKVASAMAAHKKWRRTLISTPSALSHEAYPRWSGEEYNKGKPEGKREDFDISHAALREGWLGPDRFWRHMVTLEDAEAQGCDLFDVAELREEYSDADFRNLFQCEFIDDAQSVFPLWLLLRCCEGVEPDRWDDYKPDSARPFGNKPISIGYDPARTIDRASLSKLAVPLGIEDKWRVLGRRSFIRQSFQYQANRIKEDVDSHNVVYMGVDMSGMGYGLYEHVATFYPATPVVFNVRTKQALVSKALEVMHAGRFEYSAGDNELTRAFLMIRQTVTDGTSEVTYTSGRSDDTGHAEAAWSTMLALEHEPLAAGGGGTTVMVFQD